MSTSGTPEDGAGERLREIADTLIYRRWPEGKGIYEPGAEPELDDGQFLRAVAREVEAAIERERKLEQAAEAAVVQLQMLALTDQICDPYTGEPKTNVAQIAQILSGALVAPTDEEEKG